MQTFILAGYQTDNPISPVALQLSSAADSISA
jgi:hypothetical protein